MNPILDTENWTHADEEQHERIEDTAVHFRGRMKDALVMLTGQKTDGRGETMKPTTEDLIREIKEMEDDLIRQTKMNGIALTGCHVKTVEKSATKIVQQHRLTGHCSTLAFQVEFELTDVKEDGGFMRSITDLNIVMDGNEFKDFSAFVSGAERNKNLLLFFRTLRRFSERCEDRHKTFQHFQEKYSDVVSLPGGWRSDVMLIQNPQLPGCALMIHWNIEVTTEGEITTNIELVTKLPEKACQMDTSNLIKNSPDMFQSLLRVVGVEVSIDCIIKTVCSA
ncbi:centromere protein P [Osmerus eperlanus]|uniref:centromere protein P n=1 Tax=Osmerus eperlanus TaxID=29151 RepID=UPI002E1449E4